MKRQYTIYNICVLLALLFLGGGWNDAWGQQNTIDMSNVPIRHVMVEDLYVNPGTAKKFKFQDDDTQGNLDGYIRWFVTDKNLEEATTGDEEGNVSTSQLSVLGYTLYNNGYAWYNTGSLRPNADLCTVGFTFDENDIGKYLVCDASSVFATRETKSYDWPYTQYYYVLSPRYVSIRHIYRIRDASEISKELSDAKIAFEQLNMTGDNITSLLNAPNKSECFLYEYDIHVPIESGTNYRLPMRLENYYIGTTPATKVRWRMYNADGSFIETKTTDNNPAVAKDNLLMYTFKTTSITTAQKHYIIAEVATPTSGWYPVSFLNITLEPYVDAKTYNFLSTTNDENYAERKTDNLIQSGKYERIVNIQFEDEDEVVSTLDVNDNFKTEPSEYESYYAFGEPNSYPNRDDNRVSVGRGEYALFRSLNYPNISTRFVAVTSAGGTEVGKYNDYFFSEDAISQGIAYNVQAVDRLAEKTKNTQFGYFMYIDANDYPGVITKIPLGDQTLCANTSLIVSAWICELSQTDARGYDYAPADVGFTFKKRNNTTGDETILSKFYSGMLEHETSDNGKQALWQQVSFKFNIPEQLNENEEYLLEISNNSKSSYGADYAIDDIQVLRSLPNISVQRENACTSSTLEVRSDYKTLLQNMGWDVDPNVLDKSDLSEVNIRKYRYGLMGNDPYADVINSTVGNVYYGFTDKEIGTGNVSASVDNWITVNKDAYSETNETLKKLSKIMRVAVPTKDPGQGDLQSDTNTQPYTLPASEEEALKNEIIMNVRALNDFISDMGPKTINGVDNQTIWTSDKLADFESLTGLTIDQLKENLGKLCELTSSSSSPPAATTGKAKWVYVEEIMENSALNDTYEESIRAMYTFLQIPRIRCPWKIEDNIYLGAIDVENTDLKFYGEKIEGQTAPASGEYEVIVFGAQSVVEAGGDPTIAIDHINFNDKCLSHSAFIVRPSITITVDGEAQASGVTCYNSIHTLEADLWVWPVDEYGNDTGEGMKTFEEEYPNNDYTFDWFLGNENELKSVEAEIKDSYGGEKNNLQALLKACRNELNETTGNLTSEAIEASDFYKDHQDDAELLIELLGDGDTEPQLAFGKEVRLRWVEYIIAMPYVPDFTEGVNIYSFCLDQQGIPLAGDPNVPELSVGFPNIPDDIQIDNVPLRLGLRHLQKGITLNNIPIQEVIDFGVASNDGGSLGIYKIEKDKDKDIEDKEILLRLDGSIYVPVAELKSLFAKNGKKTNNLSLTFKEPGDGYSYTLGDLFKEGEIYSLYIPFGEYDSNNEFIEGSCEGYAVLQIKVVPEYLTWKGSSSNNWYDESEWNQSTEGELYFDQGATVGTSPKDANGTDADLTKAYSPLYFTKVTVGGSNPLSLESKEVKDLNVPFLNLEAGYTIQYDMAVDTLKDIDLDQIGVNERFKIAPYYINKVEQIYFKPEATMLNQHLLDYQKAWVEFEMANMEKRWMASPLQNVYAGDIYAPKSNGRQETAAFTDINYSTSLNSRWAPAFYQKAWNSAVKYSKVEGVPNDDEIATVSVVKNNWSIEYNDVTVQYPIGKGFYLSVEDIPVKGKTLVRLPKADKSYKYESAPLTRALNTTARTEQAGRLAELDPTNNYVVQLDKAYNNGHYYLIGNPAMAYLKMEGDDGFLQKNGITKYWTYQEGTFSATVDNMTDEDAFEGGQSNGYIAPMQAFFIEWPDTKGDDETTVSFTPEMFVSKPADSGTESVAYNAFNPTLTLTAERGDQRSVAKLATREDAHDGYEEAEDAIALIDSELDVPVVYTVAGTAAAQVNALQTIRNVGLGIYDEAGGEVTLAIEGMSQLAEPLYLYDAQTRKSVELVGDRYELTVEGESHGRYFLQSGLSIANDRIQTGDDISIYSLRSGEIVATSAGSSLRSVRVYGIGGELVAQQSLANQSVYRLRVPGNAIYVVYAEDMDGIIRNVKLRVR